MKLADWRRQATHELAAVADETAIAFIEADVLLCHVLSQSRSWLFAHSDTVLDAAVVDRLDALLLRRLAQEPMAYITGDSEFRSRNYRVTPAVLIPRDDTEVLVDAATTAIAQRLAAEGKCSALDAGTGSGIVAISLCKEVLHPGLVVMASDRDSAALQLARENASSLDAAITFIQGHWIRALAAESVDVLISNPPYIPLEDSHLQKLKNEPQVALVSGVDGLDAIRELVIDAKRVLRRQGVLLLEHGYDQRNAVRELLEAAGYVDIVCHQDLAKHDRVTGARLADIRST